MNVSAQSAPRASTMGSSSFYPDPSLEVSKCKEFLLGYRDSLNELKYVNILAKVANRMQKIVQIQLDDVFMFKDDAEFVQNVQQNSARYIQYFEEVIDKILPSATVSIESQDTFDVLEFQRANTFAQQEGQPAPTTGIPQSLKRRYEVCIIPRKVDEPRRLREVKAEDVGHLIKIRGLVTKASDVKPRVKVCTYICEVCGADLFQDVISSQFMPTIRCTSKRCTDNKTNGKISFQAKGSKFVKYQELKIQELPDQVPVGHIPRSMTIHCSGELTRKCIPGDIVTVSGVFLTVRYSGYRAITAGLQADTYLEACSIEKQKLSFDSLLLEDRDERMLLEIAKNVDPYSYLASSIAPEIYGHEDVKKALLLQMVGGVTRDLEDGMRIRGDINICLMGDPGVAKSQLLKYIATIAPRGVYTTGKGSSGVGLTAAVVRDAVTGDLTLEGGALVLADMGICCIDEFDKMDEHDRTAIHEVMEQQTISIAKAGITTTLNARAAVLAAANPLYGRYNVKKSISENVDLPNSLLSRFDLLFLLLDQPNLERDSALARHVLNVHKEGQATSANTPNAAPLSPDTFKRYVAAARSFNPTIPMELSNYIVEAYVKLREKDSNAGSHSGRKFRSSSSETDQAVMTARQLLSILRLSQALCRLRLSKAVSHEDVNEAIRLTLASKASLNIALEASMEGGGNKAFNAVREDTTSQIFNVIKEWQQKTGSRILELSNVEQRVVMGGFTAEQFRKCLEEYKNIGIINIDEGNNLIEVEG